MTEKKYILHCEQCKGALHLPDDDSVSMRCPYCGHEHIVPKQIREERAARLNAARKREEEAQAALRAAAEKQQRQKQIRLGMVLTGTIALVVIGAVVGLVLYIMDAAKDKRPTDDRQTGMAAVNDWLAQRKTAGCSYVVTAPAIHSGRYEWEANLQQGGDCIQVVAAINDGTTSLQMSLTAPDMTRTNAKKHGPLYEITHCGQRDGKYPVRVLPSTNNWFTYAAIACPRILYEKPPPTDAISTGAEAVAKRMKELHQMGCTSIVHHAKQASGDIGWTPEFPKSKRADCLVVLAATGITKNTLSLSVKNPFGEALPVSEPALMIDELICSDTGGAHPISVSAATNAPYTFAAVGCPRKVANKLKMLH